MHTLGPLDDEERVMMNQLVAHFVNLLNHERGKNAELTRQAEAMRERMSLLECSIYGSSFL